MAASDREQETLMKKDVLQWNVADVGKWLSFVGLDDLKKEFIANDVSGLELLELDQDDLMALGVQRVGSRKKLLREIRLLIEGGGGSGPTSAQTPSTNSGDSWESGSQHSSSSSSRRASSSSSSSKSKSKSKGGDGDIEVKVYYQDRASVFDVRSDMRLSDFKRKVRKHFGKRLTMRYADEDGDKMTLRRDRDWRRAKRSARNGRLKVYGKAQKSNEAAAQDAELRVMEQLSDAVIMIDEKGIIQFFNSAAEKMFGYKRGLIMGSNVKILMPDEVAIEHDSYLRNYMTTGEAKVIGSGRRVTAQRKNGEKMDVFLTLSETKTRKSRSFIGTLQSLDGRADVDVVRVDQTSHYTILESIVDAAIVINEQGTVQFFNSAASELFGHRAARVVGKNINMLMQGKDKREHDDYLKRYLATGNATVIGSGRAVVGVHRDGRMIPVHLSVSEQKVGGKRLYTGIVRPTSPDDDEDEGAKRSVIEDVRDVLDSLLVAAVVIDDHGQMLAFNEAAQSFLGYSLLKVLNKNVKMIMPQQYAQEHDSYLEKWRAGGPESVFGVGRDLSAVKADGSVVKIRLSVSKRKDESGRFICIGTMQPL